MWYVPLLTREHKKGHMASIKRAAHAFPLSKLRTALLRKLLEAVKKNAAVEDRSSKQIRAAYERQEAELVRSLEHTRKVLALLRNEPTTVRDERNPVN